MNYLIFGDLHITQNSLKECEKILDEILLLCNKYSITHIIDLGDTYDNLKPSSQELDLFSNFIKNLNRPITILAANSHESETEKISIMNHFGVLNPMVKVVKEIKDEHHLFAGHFSIKESSSNYDAKLSKEEFVAYLYVFLGHIHSYQLIKPNIVHLGSSRYVSFDETKDKEKIVALITDYGTETEKVHFMKLKSPIPMIQLELGKNEVFEAQNEADNPKSSILAPTNPSNSRQFNSISAISSFLDKTDPKTKVKVKILDFESFRQFLPLVGRYDNKFSLFKYETDFTVISVNNQKVGLTETTNFKESFTKWLSQQNVDKKVKEILEKEIG